MTLIFARKNTETGFDNFASSNGETWSPLLNQYKSMSLWALLNEFDSKSFERIIDTEDRAISSEFLKSAASVAGDNGDIWGAGLNYRGHANDLETAQPLSGPGSYLRPNGCLISNGDNIVLPPHSQRVTAEAELGLMIGHKCKNVVAEDWRSVVVAVTTVLDMTAEDVIRENPRHIPWAKGFDTFCSIGPTIVPLARYSDEDLAALRVSTIRNGETIATATVSDMRYDLGFLVSYFSSGRTLLPGTVISTGTPGAAVISDGDHIEAVVEGVGHLSHRVVAQHAEKEK